MTRAIIALVLVAIASAPVAGAKGDEVLSPPYPVAELVRVVDGDTMDARITVVDPLTGVATTSARVYADGADLGEALLAADGLAVRWPADHPWCD
jgi:endonuclease YncB( thermonuclease family)